MVEGEDGFCCEEAIRCCTSTITTLSVSSTHIYIPSSIVAESRQTF